MIEQVNFNNPLDAKGRIKVELFEDGNKVSEVKSNNFISKEMKEHAYKLAIKSLFTQNRKTGAFSIYGYMQDMFQVMYLTDAGHAPDPENEWLVKGSLIGFAFSDSTSNVSSATMMGSYNTYESSTTKDRVKMVFDFPTNASNGTIKSVYFRNNDPNALFKTETARSFLYDRPLRHNAQARFYKGKIYVLGDDYSSEVTAGNRFRVFDSSFNLLNEYTLSQTFYDFEIYNDKLFFTRNNNNTGVIYTSTIDNPNVLSIALNALDNNFYPRGIAWDESRSLFVVLSSSTSNGTSGATAQYTEYDSDFNKISTIVSRYAPFNIGMGKLRYYDGEMYVTVNGASGYRRLLSDYGVSGYLTQDFLCIVGDKMLMYNGYLQPKLEFASRCLLDTPITKNANQTMKITYEFILE